MKGLEKVFEANGVKNQAGVAILITNRLQVKTGQERWRRVTSLLIKESIDQENISVLKMDAPNSWALKRHKMELKTPMNTNPVTMSRFNTTLSPKIGHPNKNRENSETFSIFIKWT